MPLIIVLNDITKIDADAIVNAANTDLRMGGGVCGAIFEAAGQEKLQNTCREFAPIQTGEAVITPGFNLPAKYVIHAAGPVYRDGKHGEEALLRSCYTNALNVAQENGCESIAFPLISSGIYGYPKDEALSVATSAISEWLLKSDTTENGMDVSLVVFSKPDFALSRKLRSEIEALIDEDNAEIHVQKLHELFEVKRRVTQAPRKEFPTMAAFMRFDTKQDEEFDDVIERLDESFSSTLLRLIEAKGLTYPEAYTRSNIGRKLFSKIRNDQNYRPKKETVLAFAVGLRLTTGETADLLRRAGFTIPPNPNMFERIVMWAIRKSIYNIYEINNVLFQYDQTILGEKARD